MKMIRQPHSKDGWYEITPGDAQQLLDNRAPNRAINERRALTLSHQIKSGKYGENGETIIFNDSGRVVDGQHRLRACVIANRPIVSFCVFGIPTRLMATIDDGAKRTAGDVLGMSGHSSAMVCASVAKWLNRYEKGGSLGAVDGRSGSRLTNREIVDIMKKNEDIQDAVDFIANLKGCRDILSPSAASFCYLMAARLHPDKADQFFTRLSSGEALSGGNPVLTLRNRLIGLKGERSGVGTAEIIAIVIKSWNAFISGKEMRLARYSGKSKESYPRFEQA